VNRVAAAFVLLAGCASSDGPAAVRVGVDVDASSLDPRLMRDTTSYRVVDLLYDGLVRLDRFLRPLPALANSWESPEPTRWVFHLREGVRFHDGTELSSEDVVHTFETLLDPAFGAPLRSLYEPIMRVEAIDAHTIAIVLEMPYAPLLSYLDVGIVPREAEDLGSRPVGTGPYRLSRWERGSKIALEANRGYWGGAPSVGEIEMVVVSDNTARAQAFEAGDLDLIQSPLSPQDIRRLLADPRFRSHLESGADGFGKLDLEISSGLFESEARSCDLPEALPRQLHEEGGLPSGIVSPGEEDVRVQEKLHRFRAMRTFQEWEQRRRAPSGAARTLLRIAVKNPGALLDVA
jgi:peptide/nickel transport system substrate-binding protein